MARGAPVHGAAPQASSRLRRGCGTLAWLGASCHDVARRGNTLQLGPGLASRRCRRPAAVPQQELAQPVAGSQLFLVGCLTSSHQIPQRLVDRVRHPDRRQLPGSVAPGQLVRVQLVGIDSVARLGRDQRRRHDFTGHTQLRELPVQHVACRPCLLADAQALGRYQLLDQLAHRLGGVGDRAQRADFFVSALRGHNHGDRLGGHVQPGVSAHCSASKSLIFEHLRLLRND